MLTPEQAQSRLGKIGASDLNTLMPCKLTTTKTLKNKSTSIDKKYLIHEEKGMFVYQEPFDKKIEREGLRRLAFKKAMESLTGNVFDDLGRDVSEVSFTNKYMEWGNEHEQEAIDVFCATKDTPYVSDLEITQDELCVHADALTRDAVVEIKCPTLWEHYLAKDPQHLIKKYSTQAQTYMWLCNKQMAYLVSYQPNADKFGIPLLYVSELTRDPEHIEQIKQLTQMIVAHKKKIIEELN